MNSISNREESVPSWTKGLSQEDINTMHRMFAIDLLKLLLYSLNLFVKFMS